MRIELTEREIVVICRALDAAVREAVSMDYLGAIAEYTPASNGWCEVDENGTTRNKEIALLALAKLTRDSWGVATMEGGIEATRKKRADAVRYLPFATPYNRERSGRLWIYTSAEGSQYTVGRIQDLLKAGFEFTCALDTVDAEAGRYTR